MFSKLNHITLLKNEPLKNHCSLKIGGNAQYFIYAHNIDALLNSLEICNQHSLRYKIIGNGSNMLFDDLGYSGIIIKYDDHTINIKNGTLHAHCGCLLTELIQYTKQHSLGGFEFAVGVPAQLGGAIVNNLGAYECEISTYLEHITILKNNQITSLAKSDCGFCYHHSNLKTENSIVLQASFTLPYQDPSTTQAKCIEFFNKRKIAQPLDYPNAGSIFKRNYNIIPAQLIDHAGLKGLTIGGAQISLKHAGFIINLGNATCKNILKLIEITKNKILDKYGVNLVLEIEYLPYK